MIKRLLLTLVVLVGLGVPVGAQVTVPNTLVAGTTITAAGLNTNFTTIANHALDRLSGGTISGNILVDALITIDGVDVGVQACITCTPTHAKLVLTDTSATSLTVGGGLTVGTGSVALVSAAGQIPALSSTYFASLSGANLTGLVATNLASGTVPTARLGSGTANSTTFLRGDSTWATGALTATTAKTTTYSAVANDFILATGTFTVTLPAASTNLNAVIDVKNVSTGTITVGRTGGDTIDGATSQSLVSQYQSYTFISDGTNWWIR